MAQWLGFQASTAAGVDSFPGWGTKTLQAVDVAKKRSILKENG